MMDNCCILNLFDDSIEKFVPVIIDRKIVKNRDDVLAALTSFIKTGPRFSFFQLNQRS